MSVIVSKNYLNNIILEEMDYVLKHDPRFSLNEAMLYEGMLDSINAYVGNKVTDIKGAIQNAAANAQNFAITLKKILEKPQLVKDFINILNHRVIKGYLKKASDAIIKLNIPTIPVAVKAYNFLNSKIQQIKNELQQYISNPDWKSMFIVMTFAAILKYISDWIAAKMNNEEQKEQDAKEIQDLFINFFKNFGGSVAQTVISKIGDIQTYFAWVGPLFKGIKFLLDLVAPSTKAIAQSTAGIVIEGTFDKEKSSGLHGWFQRQGGKGKSKGWVDCNTCRTDKKTGKKTCQTCGRQDGEKRSKYPACRPTPSACTRAGTSRKKSSTRVSWKRKSD